MKTKSQADFGGGVELTPTPAQEVLRYAHFRAELDLSQEGRGKRRKNKNLHPPKIEGNEIMIRTSVTDESSYSEQSSPRQNEID
jgi:hypothetical protein